MNAYNQVCFPPSPSASHFTALHDLNNLYVLVTVPCSFYV
jgi:hypothetical protein